MKVIQKSGSLITGKRLHKHSCIKAKSLVITINDLLGVQNMLL